MVFLATYSWQINVEFSVGKSCWLYEYVSTTLSFSECTVTLPSEELTYGRRNVKVSLAVLCLISKYRRLIPCTPCVKCPKKNSSNLVVMHLADIFINKSVSPIYMKYELREVITLFRVRKTASAVYAVIDTWVTSSFSFKGICRVLSMILYNLFECSGSFWHYLAISNMFTCRDIKWWVIFQHVTIFTLGKNTEAMTYATPNWFKSHQSFQVWKHTYWPLMFRWTFSNVKSGTSTCNTNWQC